MNHHPYAELFPMMGEAELAELAADIKANGLSEPITTYRGAILDGRNRFKACGMVNVKPRLAEYQGKEPLAFVISHNLRRRHLTDSQRAMVAAKMADLPRGGDRGNQYTGGKVPMETLTTPTRAQAAELMNISTGSIKRARAVITKAVPQLQDMVESGEVSVRPASEVAKLPAAEQMKAVSGGVAGVREAARKAKEREEEEEPPFQPPPPREKSQYSPCQGLQFWRFAKGQLDRILKCDKQRKEALTECIAYCQNRIEKNK